MAISDQSANGRRDIPLLPVAFLGVKSKTDKARETPRIFNAVRVISRHWRAQKIPLTPNCLIGNCRSLVAG